MSIPAVVTSILAAVNTTSLAPTVNVNTANVLAKSSSCCNALSIILGNKVASSGANYTAALGSYWATQETEITPTCVVLPQTAEDVSLAVLILSLGVSQWPNTCNFAVRGGGHAPMAGSANIAKGATIDLGAFQDVTISADQKTVDIGPGANWGQVYAVLDPAGLSAQGGRVGTVGVSGLLLGGGISFFAPRYGFACDNVQNYEVVLASGEIVNANATSNTDLWNALKGGSNNFGVVTKYTMTTFEQGEFWGGNIGTEASPAEYLAAVGAFASTPNQDPYASLMSTFSISSASPEWLIISSLEYTKSPPVIDPPVFSNFTAFPQLFSSMRPANLSSFAGELDSVQPYGYRQAFSTVTIHPSTAMMVEIFDLVNSTVQGLLAKNITNLSFALLFEPLPSSALLASQGTNSLGLSSVDGDLVVVLVDAAWSNKADDSKVNSALKSLFTSINTKGTKMGAINDYIYLNYAAKFQDPISSYGSASVSKLQAAAKKYDPNAVFQKQVPGGFKLPA